MELEPTFEHLSILDEEGEVDEELEPELDPGELRSLYRCMVRARRFDELLLDWQRGGRIGTFAPVAGQEASQVGAVSALEGTDWFVPSFRETAAFLWRGGDPVDLTVFNAGWNEGVRIPEDAHDFPVAVPVASQIPHAVGLAYAARRAGEGEVVMTFFGDGATSEGDFHEAVNFAGTFDLPVVFLCQNNQWAISVPREEQTAAETLAQKALAYGVPGVQVDGNDLLAVRVAADDAVARARAGDGPTLLECVTYRLSLHTTADDPTRYRDEDEVARWEERDPIPRLYRYLVGRDVLEDGDDGRIADDVEEELEGVWPAAEARMEELGGAEAMFEHLQAEQPPYLEAQAREWSGVTAADGGAEGAESERTGDDGNGEDASTGSGAESGEGNRG
jgi:pyruvate dehydrogenase E1 component alpha subunit